MPSLVWAPREDMWLKVSEDSVKQLLLKHPCIENGVVLEEGEWYS